MGGRELEAFLGEGRSWRRGVKLPEGVWCRSAPLRLVKTFGGEDPLQKCDPPQSFWLPTDFGSVTLGVNLLASKNACLLTGATTPQNDVSPCINQFTSPVLPGGTTPAGVRNFHSPIFSRSTAHESIDISVSHPRSRPYQYGTTRGSWPLPSFDTQREGESQKCRRPLIRNV